MRLGAVALQGYSRVAHARDTRQLDTLRLSTARRGGEQRLLKTKQTHCEGGRQTGDP